MFMIAMLALLAWVPLVIVLFAVLPPRRAILATFLGGWMFLPLLTINVEGLPPVDKVTLTSAASMLAVVCFDFKTVISFRPRWLDLPVLAWCVLPFVSSITNGMGMYDGASRSLFQILQWGIPYLLGRLYFTEPVALRELALALFVAGLVYVPLCIWEIRMSPQLHRTIYGWLASGRLRGPGLGLPGYRPNVFIGHGLEVGMFMTMTTLIGFWLWHTKTVRALFGIPSGILVFAMWATTILCKNLSPIIFLHLGMLALLSVRWLRTSVLLLVFVISPVVYMALRMTGTFTGDILTQFASVIEQERAESLQFRLDAEGGIIRNAMERPVFGYGSDPMWRARLTDDPSAKNIVTDGMWIIALGQGGMAWLAALTLALLVPSLLVWRRLPIGWWEHPMFASLTGLAVLLVCSMIDSLFNATINLITLLIVGAVTSMIPFLRFGAQVQPYPALVRQAAQLRQRRQPVARYPVQLRKEPQHGQ